MLKKLSHIGYLASFVIIAGAIALSVNTPVDRQNNEQSSSVLSETTCGITTSSIFANVLEPSRIEVIFDSQGLADIRRVDIVFLEGGSSSGEKVIGKAVKETSNPQFWRMIWDTKYYKSMTSPINGSFRATVHFSNNTNCISPLSSVFNIPANNSPLMPPFEAFINPPQWSSLVNSSTGVFVDFVNLPPDLHPYVIVNWQPQIGFINSPFTRNAVYSTGPNAGSGKLRVTTIYSSKYVQAEADISVYTSSSSGSDSGGSSGSDSSGSGSGGSGSTTTNTSSGTGSGSTAPLPEISDDASLDEIINVLAPTTAEPSALSAPSRAIALVLQSNEQVRSCIETKVGNEALSKILRENRRPSGSEFRTFVRCFENQRNVVPSILAPVAPDEVKTVKESKSIAIKSLVNKIKKNTDSSDSTTLEISGTATPNTDVLLYVFSEPLVLATTADDEGNWSYTLEDPIESGEHEVYAMVDRGDGVYERSGVAGFFIGTASASEENPNALSLELVTEPTITASNRSTNLFIASTIGVVTFAGVVLISYLYFRYHGKKNVASTSNFENTPTDAESSYKNFIDGQ